MRAGAKNPRNLIDFFVKFNKIYNCTCKPVPTFPDKLGMLEIQLEESATEQNHVREAPAPLQKSGDLRSLSAGRKNNKKIT